MITKDKFVVSSFCQGVVYSFLWVLFSCNVYCLSQVRKKSREVGKAEKQLQMDLAAIEAVSLHFINTSIN